MFLSVLQKMYKEQNQTTEEDWQRAQEMIQKLEKQKMVSVSSEEWELVIT